MKPAPRKQAPQADPKDRKGKLWLKLDPELLSKLEHCKDHVIYISMLLMPKEQHVSIAGRLFQSLYII